MLLQVALISSNFLTTMITMLLSYLKIFAICLCFRLRSLAMIYVTWMLAIIVGSSEACPNRMLYAVLPIKLTNEH